MADSTDTGAATFALDQLETDLEWIASVDGGEWHQADRRLGGELPPHLAGEPHVLLTAALDDGLYSLDRVVLGRPVVQSLTRPRIGVGESRGEALDNTPGEQSVEVVQTGKQSWATVHEHGVRFLRVEGDNILKVSIDTRMRPMPRTGSFGCSNPRLSELWSVGQRTLNTCMQSLMIDGAKRDRMPWVGDQVVGLIANAYSIGDPQIALDSLDALGSPRSGYVNGIVDYSLWWAIGMRLALRHFGAAEFGPERANDLDEFMRALARECDESGLLRPHSHDESFEGAGAGSVFIDWGIDRHEPESLTAVQLLWFWALTSTAEVLDAFNHSGATEWSARAETVRDRLFELAWLPEEQVWSATLERPRPGSSYPNIIAVLSGINRGSASAALELSVLHNPVNTPFMRSFAVEALGRLGNTAAAVEVLADSWGAFLDKGATTFWEDFPNETSDTAMYNRPYGRSLCHAWSAGPASLLPRLLLGIEPSADGWDRVRVDPRLGELEWASATVPTPRGDVTVHATVQTVTVVLPVGTVLDKDMDDARHWSVEYRAALTP